MSRIFRHEDIIMKSIYCNVSARDKGTEKDVLVNLACGAGPNSSGPNDSVGRKAPLAKLRGISESDS
jgi:hypothetical protein